MGGFGNVVHQGSAGRTGRGSFGRSGKQGGFEGRLWSLVLRIRPPMIFLSRSITANATLFRLSPQDRDPYSPLMTCSSSFVRAAVSAMITRVMSGSKTKSVGGEIFGTIGFPMTLKLTSHGTEAQG